MSSAELLRLCGERLTDDGLWGEFQKRFERLVLLYLLRACRISRGDQEEMREVLMDLSQEVYVHLVRNDGRVLRSFRGETEFAVKAFLARIAMNVVSDHFRYRTAGKRQAQVVSIDHAKEMIEGGRVEGGEVAPSTGGKILSWIDMERSLVAEEDRRHAARNLLLFKLHYVDGFTAKELAAFPAFGLGLSGVEAVLSRMRKRLRE